MLNLLTNQRSCFLLSCDITYISRQRYLRFRDCLSGRASLALGVGPLRILRTKWEEVTWLALPSQGQIGLQSPAGSLRRHRQVGQRRLRTGTGPGSKIVKRHGSAWYCSDLAFAGIRGRRTTETQKAWWQNVSAYRAPPSGRARPDLTYSDHDPVPDRIIDCPGVDPRVALPRCPSTCLLREASAGRDVLRRRGHADLPRGPDRGGPRRRVHGRQAQPVQPAVPRHLRSGRARPQEVGAAVPTWSAPFEEFG